MQDNHMYARYLIANGPTNLVCGRVYKITIRRENEDEYPSVIVTIEHGEYPTKYYEIIYDCMDTIYTQWLPMIPVETSHERKVNPNA